MNTEQEEWLYHDRNTGIAGFYLRTLYAKHKVKKAEFFRNSINAWFGPTGSFDDLLLATSAQFIIDKWDAINGKNYGSPDRWKGYCWGVFQNWYHYRVRISSRQKRYDKVVHRHCKDFYQQGYREDKVITEMQLDQISNLMKTKSEQDKWIYEEMLSLRKTEWDDSKGKLINFPDKVISRGTYYSKKKKLAKEIRDYLIKTGE